MNALNQVLKDRSRGKLKLRFHPLPMMEEEVKKRSSLKVSDKILKDSESIVAGIRMHGLDEQAVMTAADDTETLAEFVTKLLNQSLKGYYGASARLQALEETNISSRRIVDAAKDKEQWKGFVKKLFDIFFNNFSESSNERTATQKLLREEKKLRKEYTMLLSVVIGAYVQGYQTRFEASSSRDSTTPPPPVVLVDK